MKGVATSLLGKKGLGLSSSPFYHPKGEGYKRKATRGKKRKLLKGSLGQEKKEIA